MLGTAGHSLVLQSRLPGGPDVPLPLLLLLLELLLDVLLLDDWLRLRRDEAAETRGAHKSANRQMATNADVVRPIFKKSIFMGKRLARRRFNKQIMALVSRVTSDTM